MFNTRVQKYDTHKGNLINDIWGNQFLPYSQFTITKILGSLEKKSTTLKNKRIEYTLEIKGDYLYIEIITGYGDEYCIWKIHTETYFDYEVVKYIPNTGR